MVDATKRMSYFDRQFLRAADFQDEQHYDLDRRRRHNRLLHSPGVAEGLNVTGNINDAFVTVSAGTAYDALGQEIVLASSQQVSVAAIGGTVGTALITIAYAEQASDPSTDPGITGTSTRISEQPALAAAPAGLGQPNMTLALASVALASGKVSAAPDNTVRNQAGAVLGADPTFHSVTLRNDAVASSTWPKFICSAANTAALQTGLTIGGKVGIGTTAPDQTLTVQGSVGATYLSVKDSATTGGGPFGMKVGVDGGGGAVSTTTNHDLQLRSSGDVARVVIKTDGKVGIGTTTPDQNMTIQGTDGTTYLTIKDSSTTDGGPFGMLMGVDTNGGIVSTTTNHDLVLRSGTNATHMVLKAGGNVGVGTTTPDRHVTVEGTSGTYLNVRDDSAGGPYEILLGTDTSGGIVSTMTNHDLQLRSGGNVTHMWIKNTGNVGIGTNAPGFALDVADRIRLRQGPSASAGMWLFQTTPNNDRAFIGMATDNLVGFWGNTGATWQLVMDTGTGNVAIGLGAVSTTAAKLDVGGAVHASSFPTSSDARFKTNVTPITDALKKVAGINGVTFDWNELYQSLGRSTGRREAGVIAQDVEKVCPELVSTWHEEGYKAVDYSRLTALLVEAVKELKAKNESLEQRIAALEEGRSAPPAGSSPGAARQRSRSGAKSDPQES
jgi:Chaperone of endosialidase